MSNSPKGSILWNICIKGLDFFTKNLYRIPGNGINMLLWDDKINGNAFLNSDLYLAEIKLWLTNKGLLRVSDIVSCDNHGNWDAWVLPELPYRVNSSLLFQKKVVVEQSIWKISHSFNIQGHVGLGSHWLLLSCAWLVFSAEVHWFHS